MALETLEGLREKIDSPSGKATLFNVLRMKELGYEVERLPYSIRVLLENAARHSGTVAGALEATHALAKWPSSVGGEMPFMPYRVLLQDYTGVPLIVDLSAMRDAARAAGVDPRLVNSQVPVDLVIDHSIQVDAWSSEMAFSINLEKEYERNSERYALLKWAQSSFKNMRVFPPGKGICHQFNLEYLSQVVATADSTGELQAFPDTLVGTDSHTTMVNGLGILGWGVGGIEAEAVMLGEPYHMPIPKVYGVKLTGMLREGVTPTDLVLTVTEKLRGKNVVGSFVEYFGEGYAFLSAQDRATLGNMSPEYGATVGFCPVDAATLVYLAGTARSPLHVDFVKKYVTQTGLFVGDPEPRYSEVVVIDLDAVEPSIAGPRNPEERHPLRSVPSFARKMLEERQVAPSSSIGGTVRGQLMLEEDGPVRTGLRDGSVVISAITSCTNTSNPTVMVGAGILAKKAVEHGLSVRPWVKPSFAPGSTVVTDYLQNSDLLVYLDRLGFALVGYGCTTCISEGTPVLMADGTTRPIETLPSSGGVKVFGLTSTRGLAIEGQSRLIDNGVRDCIELVLQDGRTITCTPDHRILREDGTWVRADELVTGKDRVVIGLEGPHDAQGEDESGYVLHAGDMSFGMETQIGRARTLAFARLLGHLLNDGSISVQGQGRMNVGQAVDREIALNDIELLTGLRPAANRYDDRKWSIALPMALTKAIVALPGVQVGRRIHQPPCLPEFLSRDDCPVAVVREFLGGLFGADGHSPGLHRWGEHEDDSSLEPPAFSQSTIPANLSRTKQMFRDIVRLLSRCGVNTAGAQIYDYPTRRSRSTYPPPKDGKPRIEVRLTLPDGLSFVERVGFRYCVEKQMRASAAAVYWRVVGGIDRQRNWMAGRLEEFHQAQPTISFSRARNLIASSLVGNEAREFLPRVVSPHYALLEGYDRFSRLPKAAGRKFRPLHRTSSDFPSPVALFKELGVRNWFGTSEGWAKSGNARHYSVDKEASSLPTFSLRVLDRRPAGARHVYDLTVEGLHSFVAGTVAVHNCIGNSGPLSPEVEEAVRSKDLYAVAVLSGNRNFDGRIHPLVKGSFLMSPMLVVAYALAGRIDFDFTTTPLGSSKEGKAVYLKDIWPTLSEIKESVERALSPALYSRRYANAMKGEERWESLATYKDDVFHWGSESTYVRLPPWFDQTQSGTAMKDIIGARALAVLEDKVTTDHISPAGTIPVDGPAGRYLTEHGVGMIQFSSFGARRGNHEVMVRGGFSNIRLRNLLAGGKEGGYTRYLPTGEVTSIYDAAIQYGKAGVPLIILAGKQYGMGSSRDWAAKAPKLLGVRAVIAEDFERIHRSNLVAMGVLPLQFRQGESRQSIGLTGEETFDIIGVGKMSAPGQWLDVVARGREGEKRFQVLCRVDNGTEMKYIEKGGVLPFVFDKLLRKTVH